MCILCGFTSFAMANVDQDIKKLKEHKKKLKIYELEGELIEAEEDFVKKIISCRKVGGCKSFGSQVQQQPKKEQAKTTQAPKNQRQELLQVNNAILPRILGIIDNKVLFDGSNSYMSVGEKYQTWIVEKIDQNCVIVRSTINSQIQVVNYTW